MPSVIVIISLFAFLLLYIYSRTRRITISVIVVSFYLMIAFCGIFVYKEYTFRHSMSVFASIYLFIICLLFFIPLLGKKSIFQRGIHIRNTNTLKIFIGLYIVFSSINTMEQLLVLRAALFDGNLAALKAMAYDGEIVLNYSFFMIISRLYVSGMWPVILLYGFYILTHDKRPFFYGLLFIILGFVPQFVTCLLYVYRGGLGILVLLCICCYYFMCKNYSKTRKKQFFILFTVIAGGLVTLIITITISRFGEASSENSLIEYFGQSMINFNGGVATRIHSYANGKYFLASFYDLTANDVCNDSLYGIESNNGSNLHTFVGNLVLDFGFFWGFIFSLLVSLGINHLIANKRYYDFADAALCMFYLLFIFNGAFHSACGYALDCFIFIMLYLVLKVSNKKLTWKINLK